MLHPKSKPDRQQPDASLLNIQKRTTSQDNNQTSKPSSNYLDELANSTKLVCQGCRENTFLVYLSCGCHNLCPNCVLEKKICQIGHQYD